MKKAFDMIKLAIFYRERGFTDDHAFPNAACENIIQAYPHQKHGNGMIDRTKEKFIEKRC